MVEYGVDEADIFQTNDLFEKKDLANVTNTIFALGRAVSCFQICFKPENTRTKVTKNIFVKMMK